MVKTNRDYAAEYRRRKELQAERAAAALRAKRATYQRDYRRRLKEAKAAGFQSVREFDRERAFEGLRTDRVDELLGKRRRGSRIPNAGAVARTLLAAGINPREFFKAWYA